MLIRHGGPPGLLKRNALGGNPKTIQLYFPHIDLTVHGSYHYTEGINE